MDLQSPWGAQAPCLPWDLRGQGHPPPPTAHQALCCSTLASLALAFLSGFRTHSCCMWGSQAGEGAGLSSRGPCSCGFVVMKSNIFRSSQNPAL